MHHWIVMLTVGSFNSLSPPGGLYMWRYIDRFSSRPQLAEQWSTMTLPTGLPPSESSRLATFVSPRRNRRWRMTTSWVSTHTVAPRMQTRSPGAVCRSFSACWTSLGTFGYWPEAAPTTSPRPASSPTRNRVRISSLLGSGPQPDRHVGRPGQRDRGGRVGGQPVAAVRLERERAR